MLLLSATAATAATPVQYRSTLNGVCRSYTPKLKALQTSMNKAAKANNPKQYGIALGHFLVLALAQDVRLEAQPVPAALRSTMTPILTLLKKIDAHDRLAIAAAEKGDGKGLVSHLNAIGKLAGPLNPEFDAAGLKDCGSNQS